MAGVSPLSSCFECFKFVIRQRCVVRFECAFQGSGWQDPRWLEGDCELLFAVCGVTQKPSNSVAERTVGCRRCYPGDSYGYPVVVVGNFVRNSAKYTCQVSMMVGPCIIFFKFIVFFIDAKSACITIEIRDDLKFRVKFYIFGLSNWLYNYSVRCVRGGALELNYVDIFSCIHGNHRAQFFIIFLPASSHLFQFVYEYWDKQQRNPLQPFVQNAKGQGARSIWAGIEGGVRVDLTMGERRFRSLGCSLDRREGTDHAEGGIVLRRLVSLKTGVCWRRISCLCRIIVQFDRRCRLGFGACLCCGQQCERGQYADKRHSRVPSGVISSVGGYA